MLIPAEKFRNRKGFNELHALLKHLKQRSLPETTETYINQKINQLNTFQGSEKEIDKKTSVVKNAILERLRKEHNLIPKNYYTLLWMPLGMSAFGLPIGFIIYLLTKNIAFIAIGLPMGIGLGGLYGAYLDKKAEAEGKVLKLK